MLASADTGLRRADIVPVQVTIASLLQQVQREDALDLANGAPWLLHSMEVRHRSQSLLDCPQFN